MNRTVNRSQPRNESKNRFVDGTGPACTDWCVQSGSVGFTRRWGRYLFDFFTLRPYCYGEDQATVIGWGAWCVQEVSPQRWLIVHITLASRLRAGCLMVCGMDGGGVYRLSWMCLVGFKVQHSEWEIYGEKVDHWGWPSRVNLGGTQGMWPVSAGTRVTLELPYVLWA